MSREGMASGWTSSQRFQPREDIEKGERDLQRPQYDQSFSGKTVVQSSEKGNNTVVAVVTPQEPEKSEHEVKQVQLISKKWIPSKIWFLVVLLGLGACWVPAILEWLKFPQARVWGVRLIFWSIWLSIIWAGWWIALIISWIIHMIILSCINWFDGYVYRPYANALDCLHQYFALVAWALATWISWVPVIVERQLNDGSEQSASSRSVRALNLGGRLFFAMALSTGILFLEKIAVQWVAMSFHRRAYQNSIDNQKEAVNAFKTLHSIVRKRHPGEAYSHKRGTSNTTTGLSQHSTLSPHTDLHQHPNDHYNQARSPMKTAFADAWIQIFGDVAPDEVSRAFHRKKSEKMRELAERIWECLAENSNKLSGPISATMDEQVFTRELHKEHIKEVVIQHTSEESDKTKRGKLKSYPEEKPEWEVIWKVLTDGHPQLESLTAPQFSKRCSDLHAEQWRLEGTMNDLNNVVGKLDNLMLLLWLVTATIIIAVALEAELKTLIFGAGSAFIGMSWLLRDTASEVLGSLVFLFNKHPYDVGDRIVIKSKMYTVKEMRLLSTVFWDDDSVQIQAPNKLLNTVHSQSPAESCGAAASDFTLSIQLMQLMTQTSEPFKYEISDKTTQEQLDSLTKNMEAFLKRNMKDYRPDFLVVVQELSRQGNKMVVTSDIQYNNNWESNSKLRAERRNKWVINLQKALEEAQIEGPGMPAMKVIQG